MVSTLVPLLGSMASGVQEARPLDDQSQPSPGKQGSTSCTQDEDTKATADAHASAPFVDAQMPEDLREAYDVHAYGLEIELLPKTRELLGSVRIEASVVVGPLDEIVLDLVQGWTVDRVELENEDRLPLETTRLAFAHEGDRLTCRLPKALATDAPLALTVRYSGVVQAKRKVGGLLWGTTHDGQMRMDVACQRVGAHSWWPCKASYFHPEDKPDAVRIDITVPDGLVAVSAGKALPSRLHADGRVTHRWRLDSAVPTWSVPLAVGPYVREVRRLVLPGTKRPIRYETYACPENVDALAERFAQTADILQVYDQWFGPYPFADSKLAVVDTLNFSSSGATVIGLRGSGSNWRRDVPEPERGAFDYVLAHELAHAWWGHSLTASSWCDAWLHESLASYACLLAVEELEGPEASQSAYRRMLESHSPKMRLVPCAEADSAAEGHNMGLWIRGPWVLHTLRHQVGDDTALRETFHALQRAKRFGLIDRFDLRSALEDRTGTDMGTFFTEWVDGTGSPRIRGDLRVEQGGLRLEVTNEASGAREFHVPIDLAWTENGIAHQERVFLEPGKDRQWIQTESRATDVHVLGLDKILGRHAISVVD